MSSESSKGSAFVPHDIARPIPGAATGPLQGLTVSVKDAFEIAGERMGCGNPDWLARAKPAVENAAAVQHLLDAGATVIGKTICEEFVYSIVGINAHYGMPINPRAPGRIPGGSSSGAASSVASGACDIGLGGDTGGSVRAPASFNGLYGIRTTHGRVDAAGAMPLAPSLDTIGWMTAGPGLLRKAGEALLDQNGVAAPVERVFVATDAMAVADESVQAVMTRFLRRAAGALPKQEDIVLAPDGLAERRECVRIVQAHEIWQVYGAWIEANKPNLGVGVRQRMEAARAVTDDEAKVAAEKRAEARDELRRMIAPGTVVALPTLPCIAPLASTDPTELDAMRGRIMLLTCSAGAAGLPQVTLPVGTVDGCPVGLSFIGWAGGDEALLSLAVSLGAYCGD